MQTIIDSRTMAGHARIAAAFAKWLRQEGGEDLVQSADLLGGPQWAHRAKAVITAISDDDPSAHLPELRALRKLLTLEPADVVGSLEAVLFASVHPDDVRADQARICADAMTRGVAALEALARAGRRSEKEAA